MMWSLGWSSSLLLAPNGYCWSDTSRCSMYSYKMLGTSIKLIQSQKSITKENTYFLMTYPVALFKRQWPLTPFNFDKVWRWPNASPFSKSIKCPTTYVENCILGIKIKGLIQVCKSLQFRKLLLDLLCSSYINSSLFG